VRIRALFSICTKGEDTMDRYKDSTLSIEERVKDLLSKMTIQEKIGQLNQVMAANFNKEEIHKLIKEGKVGSRILATTPHAGNEAQFVADLEEHNEAQRIAVEESRLGIPIINGRDVIHGHRTVFPIPLAQAASWDPELVEKAAAVAALEASTEGVHWTFAPMLDIARDPRWGRIIEGFGEDPYLCSTLAKSQVKGIQGDDMSQQGKIAACAKHYIGYGASEGGRDYDSIELSDNTMRNIYLPPFKAAVDAGVATVMSAFHENNGEPITASKYLLTEVLKDELGFDGFVISDWESVGQLIHQRVAENGKDAAEIALNAGVDMDMVSNCYINHVEELINEGKIWEDRLNDAVRRVLKIKFQLGLFENPYTNMELGKKIQLCEAHLETSRRLAEKSMVLLKNEENILPLPKKGKTIAVIGPMAQARRALLGSWVLDGREEEVITIIEGIKNAAPEAKLVTVNSGLTDDMILAARNADIVVLALGESNVRSGEANSVGNIILPPGQEELVEMLSRFGKPVITVICAGRPLAIERINELSKAVLYAWHPGTQGGNAIGNILFGNENPSGKLPVTMLRHLGQVPLYYNRKSNGRPIDEYFGQSHFMNYHDMTGSPLYPFGYGLSYTTFEYSDLKINKETICGNEVVEVSATITNTGGFAGEEIAQCYLRDNVSSVTKPVKELKGFTRVYLEPGKATTVTFALGKEELSFYGRDGKLCFEPGEYAVGVGGSCMVPLNLSFRYIG
jgi:beta-glucosidase